MSLETLQEILIKAPTVVAARSALTVLVGLAQDIDFDSVRNLCQGLASELGYDSQTNGFLHSQSIDEFLNAADIPPVLRIYAAGFWPRKLLKDSPFLKCLGESLMNEDGFRNFQRLVRRKAVVQNELLKGYIFGAFINMMNSNFMSSVISSGSMLEILDAIRTNCRVISGMNADTGFNFGREMILGAPDLMSFYSVVYHEITHQVIEAVGQGGQSTSAFPTDVTCAEVAGKLPTLLGGALQLKGKQIGPGDPRTFRTLSGVSLLYTYSELASGAFTHVSLMNSAGPIELREGAAWGYFILAAMGLEIKDAVAAYSPRGVFHFGFVGHGPDAAVLQQRLQVLKVSELLPGLEARSAQWLDGLVRTSRMGRGEYDIPIALGLMRRDPKFYGLQQQIVWNDLLACQGLRQDPRAAATAPNNIKEGLLCLAVRCGDSESVHKLLSAGASARARVPDGYGCVNLVGHSLCVIFDENGKSYYGPSAANLLEVVAALATAGLDLNEPLDAVGNTLLHGAAGRNIELTQFLLAHGARVDVVKADGRTPLFEAASFGPLAVIPVLVNAGADIKKRSNNGNSVLHDAVERGDENIIMLLLQSGADVNAASADGETALMRAAIRAQTGIVKLLLGNGADVEAPNSLGQTAMHFAVWSHDPAAQILILEMLLTSGADVEEETNDGSTPLMLAALKGKSDTVKFLLSRQANVNAVDKKGNSVLIRALKSEARHQKDFIQEFLNQGADPLHVNAAGESPLTLTPGDSLKEINHIINEAATKRMMIL